MTHPCDSNLKYKDLIEKQAPKSWEKYKLSKSSQTFVPIPDQINRGLNNWAQNFMDRERPQIAPSFVNFWALR